MNMIFLIFILFLVLWFFAVGAAAFHVTKYSSPNDKLIFSFFGFFIIAAGSFFWVLAWVMEVL